MGRPRGGRARDGCTGVPEATRRLLHSRLSRHRAAGRRTRVHPFCPIFAAGRVFAAIPRSSPKGNDLRRDGRYVVHALSDPDDAEFSIRGTAAEVDDPDVLAVVYAAVDASGVGGMMESVRHDAVFEFDLERADAAHWENVGQAGTYAVRHRWVSPR